MPSGRAFLMASSRKSAARPALPLATGSAPRKATSEVCIFFWVALVVLKAANAAFPAPSVLPSVPPDRVNGGFIITRSNFAWPTLDTRSRTSSGARPPAETAAAVSMSDC